MIFRLLTLLKYLTTMGKTILALFFILTCLPVLAQLKNLDAIKTSAPIKIDGNLDDAGWLNIIPVSDFIGMAPSFGKPASQRTVVKITYDNTALYIGAYLYDNPTKIRKQITARDVLDRQDADVFTVELDTYHDKQNGFQFQVSAAGVQGDAKISQNLDRSWDAVWESKVSLKKDGWVAEMRIPFSAIRFPKASLQNWGLQFTRFRRKTNETTSWSPENPDISGSINQWGLFSGLKNITPPLRLSFLPYLSGGMRVSPVGNSRLTETLKSGGMDVKYGINESFTLDITLIPDFAQVQSDNVILNLSPFDVKFSDFRPFFTEGTELFNKANLFYSRRIGAQPSGTNSVLNLVTDSPFYKIITNPGITRLYNATKISGRTKHNLGIGVLNALTATMHSEIENTSTGKNTVIETEPFTNYNIIVLDQAFKNRSSVTFTNTNVLRKGNSRNANVSAVDLTLFDKKNIHGLFWDGIYSNIWGKNGNKDGYRTDLQYSKVSGKIQYYAASSVLSDTYDPNDLGFLLSNNSFNYSASLIYNNFTATKNFLWQRFEVNFNNSYLYKPFQWQSFRAEAKAFVLLKNYWDFTLDLYQQPFWTNDFFEARTPGRVMKRKPYYLVSLYGSSDSRKKLFFSYNLGYAESPLPNDPFHLVEFGLRYRINDKIQVNADYTTQVDEGNWGFAYRDTLGNPIIARRNVKTNITVIGADYNLNARMNTSIRLRHYWSNVHNTDFFDLKDDGYLTPRSYLNGYDLNFNTFNIDMFYTWDFLYGSRITIAWKNALGADVSIDGSRNNTYLKNFGSSLSNPHSNEVSIKIVYYLDYLNLQKKRSEG